MKRLMKRLLVPGLLAGFAAFAWMSLPHPDGADEAGAKGELAQGVVLAVDGTAGYVTISHGALQSLGMPPMTMIFRAANAAQLQEIRAGDRVRFRVTSKDGELRAGEIEVAR
jgi:Cu(I)/Ag(I) efflux system periplasmic protein CusF